MFSQMVRVNHLSKKPDQVYLFSIFLSKPLINLDRENSKTKSIKHNSFIVFLKHFLSNFPHNLELVYINVTVPFAISNRQY